MTPDRRLALTGLAGYASLEVIWSVLPDARLVGGVVRDLLADRPVADLDLATPERPDRVYDRLQARAIRVIPTGLSHGTVTAIVDGHSIEITTLRRDVQTDGRHAIVAWTDNWREDAARRDFTINAMSLDRSGLLHDYFDGAGDLAARRIRFVGHAGTRIAEDALRILRFFRFQARYGDDTADMEAMQAIRAGVSLLHHLSAERVWSELKRLLQSDAPAGAVRLMQELGVLDALLPGRGDPLRLEALLRLQAPAEPVLRLAALACGPVGAIAARLRLSGSEANLLAALRDGPRPDPAMDDSALRRLLADEPATLLSARSWLSQLEREDDPSRWDALRRRLAAMPRPVLPISGRDGLAVGLPPGPALGEALRRVAVWWRAGGCVADHACCFARLSAIAGGGE